MAAQHNARFVYPGKMARRRKSITSELIGSYDRVDPRDVVQRLRERDARLAADTRNDMQKFLGDPEPARSALAQGSLPNRKPVELF